MALKPKKKISDDTSLTRTIHRIASQLAEAYPDFKNVVLVGVHTRGVPIAKRIAKALETLGVKKVPLGALDITLYRDDLTTVSSSPVLPPTPWSRPRNWTSQWTGRRWCWWTTSCSRDAPCAPPWTR